MAKYCFFGKCHIDISRSDYFIHLRNALCTKSKGCNRLCTAHLIDLIYSGKICSGKGRRIYFAFFITGSSHYDFFYPSHFCRQHIHQYGRRICCFSTRYIHACTGNRCHLLPKHHAIWSTVKPTVLPLFLMISSDIIERFFHHCNQLLIYQMICFFNLFSGHFDGFFIDICAVKLFGIGENSTVSLSTHLFNNSIYIIFILFITVWTSL